MDKLVCHALFQVVLSIRTHIFYIDATIILTAYLLLRFIQYQFFLNFISYIYYFLCLVHFSPLFH